MPAPKITLEKLSQRAPNITEAVDTTSFSFQQYINEVDSWYQGQSSSYAQIDKLALKSANNAIGLRIALKIAESYRIIRNLQKPVTVTLLNPVYKERGRMQPRDQHPHGEDSIRAKINILKKLESLNDKFTARFVVIDDDDPTQSGLMAQEILQEYPEEFDAKKYRVLFLGVAIDQDDPDLPPTITHKSGSNRSVKGGALLFGMRKTINDAVDGLHILIDNDADLSIHPGQIGLIIEDIVTGKASAVAGSRREPDSAALIASASNTRGRLFIKIWQYLLPDLARKITDTNRAFKAFSADGLRKILSGIRIYTFPYQIELLQACISHGVVLSKRGIAYVDSEAASTQRGDNITETYLNQIRQIIDISNRYNTIDQKDELIQYFENISEADWLEIEQNPPTWLLEKLERRD